MFYKCAKVSGVSVHLCWLLLLPLILIAIILGRSYYQQRKLKEPTTSIILSSSFDTLEQRVHALHEFAPTSHTYQSLDFRIVAYTDNSGPRPRRAGYDLALIATVPVAEIDDWIPRGLPPHAYNDAMWLWGVPAALDRSAMHEWYTAHHYTIGIDRTHRIVAYGTSLRH